MRTSDNDDKGRGWMRQLQVKEYRRSPADHEELGRGKEGSPIGFRGSWTLPTLYRGLPAPRDCGTIRFSTILWYFVTAAPGHESMALTTFWIFLSE